jgi:hypothetical protein
MPLPTRQDALARIHELAELEAVQISTKARRQTENLGYLEPDIYDLLYALEPEHWEKLEESHWDATIPVGTFCAYHQCADRDEEDELFLEVAINPEHLYLLACKPYGSPQ